MKSGFRRLAQTLAPDLQSSVKIPFPSASFLHNSMERWQLLFGILFILVVVFFSKGHLGTVNWRQKRLEGFEKGKVLEDFVRAASWFRR